MNLSSISTKVPRSINNTNSNKKKMFFFRKLEQFNSWPITDLKKLIRTAKRIIRKAVSQKTSNNIPTYTKLAGNPNMTIADPFHYIVKLSSPETINNRTSTTMNNYYNSLPTSTHKNHRFNQNNKQNNKQK